MKKTHYWLAVAVLASMVAVGGYTVSQAASNKPSAQAIAIAKDKNGGNPLPSHIKSELLRAYAKALDLTVDQLKVEMQSNTIYQIAKSKGLGKSAFRKKVGEALQQDIDSGVIKGAKANYYSDYIAWTKSSANQD